jgi:hypothetical protein
VCGGVLIGNPSDPTQTIALQLMWRYVHTRSLEESALDTPAIAGGTPVWYTRQPLEHSGFVQYCFAQDLTLDILVQAHCLAKHTVLHRAPATEYSERHGVAQLTVLSVVMVVMVELVALVELVELVELVGVL